MAGGWTETRCRTGKNLKPRNMPDCPQGVRRIPSFMTPAYLAGDSMHAVLGAFGPSQFSHKRTLPKNANRIKNTTKPNSFLARETIRGYTFDTNIHIPLPPALPCTGAEWNFRAAMPPLPWLKKH